MLIDHIVGEWRAYLRCVYCIYQSMFYSKNLPRTAAIPLIINAIINRQGTRNGLYRGVSSEGKEDSIYSLHWSIDTDIYSSNSQLPCEGPSPIPSIRIWSRSNAVPMFSTYAACMFTFIKGVLCDFTIKRRFHPHRADRRHFLCPLASPYYDTTISSSSTTRQPHPGSDRLSFSFSSQDQA